MIVPSSPLNSPPAGSIPVQPSSARREEPEIITDELRPGREAAAARHAETEIPNPSVPAAPEKTPVQGTAAAQGNMPAEGAAAGNNAPDGKAA